MHVRQKTARTLDGHQIFGDEEAARLFSEVAELRSVVGDLAERVHAQFTTISAHAEIARQQVEFVRDEARSDLDRTRTMLIDLLDQTRRDAAMSPTQTTLPAPPAGSPIVLAPAAADRIDAVEARVHGVIDRVEQCFERQRELAATMSALLDTVLGSHDEPVAGLSLA